MSILSKAIVKILEEKRSENTDRACLSALNFLRINPSIETLYKRDADAALIVACFKHKGSK